MHSLTRLNIPQSLAKSKERVVKSKRVRKNIFTEKATADALEQFCEKKSRILHGCRQRHMNEIRQRTEEKKDRLKTRTLSSIAAGAKKRPILLEQSISAFRKTISPVSTYSYGTPQHYDEIVRDIIQISSGQRALGNKAGEPSGQGLSRLYNDGLSEVNQQDETELKKVLLEMIKMILNKEGRIFYAKGSCRNKNSHFDTQRPTYFDYDYSK